MDSRVDFIVLGPGHSEILDNNYLGELVRARILVACLVCCDVPSVLLFHCKSRCQERGFILAQADAQTHGDWIHSSYPRDHGLPVSQRRLSAISVQYDSVHPS